MTRELSPEERATVVRFGIHSEEILRDLDFEGGKS